MVENDKWCSDCNQMSTNSKRILQGQILMETDICPNHTTNNEGILVTYISSQLYFGNERLYNL